MQRIILGRSQLDVPVFAVGTAPLAQVNPAEGLRVLQRAVELGATWWDTSDDYGTVPLVARAMADFPRDRLIISTKSYAAGHGEGTRSVQDALENLHTDYLDMMFLHYVRDEADFQHRQGALDAFREAKQQGTIRAIGLSSHQMAGIRCAITQPDIDVVMAPWNVVGQLPDGGSRIEMEQAIRACYDAGLGMILMKLLGYGVLRNILDEAIHAGARFPLKHALNIGVKAIDELEIDIRLALGEPVDANLLRSMKGQYPHGRAA